MSVLDVFDRWIHPAPTNPHGSRWFRRHGFPPEEDTAHSTIPKGGARLRRYREEHARYNRRVMRGARQTSASIRDGRIPSLLDTRDDKPGIVAAAGRSGTQRAS